MKDSPLRPARPRNPPPLHGFNNALDTILVVFICLVVAVALGVAIAALMRHRKLAWTWGSLGLPVAALVVLAVCKGMLPGKAGPGAAAASLGGLAGIFGWGLYRRVEDYRAGGDRETSAAEERGLLDGVRRRLTERRDHVGSTLTDGLPVGRTQRGELALVRRGSAESGSHV